jgi:hypothetical protein
MTNEEAIKELKIIREDYWDEYSDTMPALDMAIKALEQQSEDAISRAETVQFLTNHSSDFEDVKIRMAFQAASSLVNNPHNLPPVQPKHNPDEWCHDCKEYDHDKHCCPRYNGVIRKTVEEIKQPKIRTGHWIKYGIPRCGEQHYKCTLCGYYINFGQWGELYTKEFKYCPNCGCRMVEPQAESEE